MSDKVYIIAEAGVNHNGSMELAKELVLKAKEAGVDAVKFQTFKTENLVTKSAQKAEYQIENTKNAQESQFDMIKKLELSYDDFKELKGFCSKHGIQFLSTAFDLESIEFLNKLGIEYFKIPSGELTNYPYIRKIASLPQKVILSTGMASLEEIEETINVLEKFGKKRNDITVLHCNTEYPTPLEDVHLRAMDTIGKTLSVDTGYSDHTAGIMVSIAAAARGAKIIEKHFTLDKEMEGPDHKASLDPQELKNMTAGIRIVEQILGRQEKSPTKSEIKNMAIARKSLVAATDIKKGDLFSEENLTTKRPGDGISPMKWESYIGQESQHDYKKDDLIK